MSGHYFSNSTIYLFSQDPTKLYSRIKAMQFPAQASFLELYCKNNQLNRNTLFAVKPMILFDEFDM